MDIKEIIREQRKEIEEIEKREKIIFRESLDKARNFLKYPNILVITGIRRCGKSIFSYLAEKDKKFGYINFDDERIIDLKSESLDKVLQSFYELYGKVEYIILDEIQNIPKWELFANRLRRTKKIIITGSNSKLLSGELATHLTGRHLDIQLFPFSFKEFLNFKEFKIQQAYTSEEKSQIKNYLEEFLKNGGFPESYKFGGQAVIKVYDDILTKDILLRYNIKKINELKQLGKYVLSNSSEEISYSRLAKLLGVKHVSTISNWISYFKEAFLIFELERFSFKLKQQFVAPKKIYCVDTGLVNLIGFKFSENKGKIIENAVAIELYRRKSQDYNLGIYYWKDHQQRETDFVLKKRNKVKQLIQVSYVNSKENIKEREITSLLRASKDLKCNNLLVISWDYDGEIKREKKTIKIISLWRWLLEK
ncbi:ATP-binding protein [Candidatus Pacearchaeota archaeon]|nr:ATP-binding protein [Candidatus Pacearchaeota archaeon]MBI2056847.1 ATP-binding protein [Candidatus Pacearchaeota archaeon]